MDRTCETCPVGYMTERDLEKLSRDGDRAIARLVRRMQRHGTGKGGDNAD